jgi:hypothetical protein
VPVADPAGALAGVRIDDPVLPGAGLPVPGLPLGDPLPAFGAAQMGHHRGIAHQPLEQWQIAVAPRLNPDGWVIAGHRFWSVPASRERYALAVLRT